MNYYTDDGDGHHGGPFSDTIQIDTWANENLKVGDRFTVIYFPTDVPKVYGVAECQGIGKFLKWIPISD